MRKTLCIELNGAEKSFQVDPETPLLFVLRNCLGVLSPKYGCGLEQCGACTVLVDGAPRYACTLPVEEVGGRRVTTLEGLGTRERPHVLQTAFLQENAGQCGYCVSGILMRAAALLEVNGAPSEAEVKRALASNLCRCGSHPRFVRAVLRAAGMPLADDARSSA